MPVLIAFLTVLACSASAETGTMPLSLSSTPVPVSTSPITQTIPCNQGSCPQGLACLNGACVLPPWGVCQSNEQCGTGQCANQDASGNGVCSCSIYGGSCTTSSDCCEVQQVCVRVPAGTNGRGTCCYAAPEGMGNAVPCSKCCTGRCDATGAKCACQDAGQLDLGNPANCCSRISINGVCTPRPDFSSCLKDGSPIPCKANTDCCSMVCNSATGTCGADGCRPPGQPATDPKQCCPGEKLNSAGTACCALAGYPNAAASKNCCSTFSLYGVCCNNTGQPDGGSPGFCCTRASYKGYCCLGAGSPGGNGATCCSRQVDAMGQCTTPP